MRKLKHIKLFESFLLTSSGIKRGDKVTIKKEKILAGGTSGVGIGREFTGYLKYDLQLNTPITLVDHRGNNIMNTTNITQFHPSLPLLRTSTSQYSLKKVDPNAIKNPMLARNLQLARLSGSTRDQDNINNLLRPLDGDRSNIYDEYNGDWDKWMNSGI